MAIDVKVIKRVFSYNGMNLEDPDPGMSVEDVRGFYANLYPELTNAAVTSSIKNNTTTYIMKVAAGTKG